jgi:hypothetical protein
MLIFSSIAATGAVSMSLSFISMGRANSARPELCSPWSRRSPSSPACCYLMYAVSMRVADPFHLILLAGTAAVLLAAVVLADPGLSLAWSQVVVAVALAVTIVGYETVGYRHLQEHRSKLRA